MITELRLKAFKQHLDRVFTFAPGLNTIQGENGQGKTNILRAILFALQGASAAGNKARLTTRGSSGMKVELDCTFEDVGAVTIIRTLTRAEVKQDGKVIASGQTDVTAWVEARLGMNAAMFKSMLYAEQNRTQKLLDDGPSALQKQLETIAETKVIDQILVLIGADNNHDQGVLSGLGELADISELRTRQTELKGELTELSRQLGLADQDLTNVTETHREVKASYDAALKAKLDGNRTQENIARAEGELAGLRSQQEQLKQNTVEAVSDIDIPLLEQQIKADTQRLNDMQSDHNRRLNKTEEYDRLLKISEEMAPWRDVLVKAAELNDAEAIARDAFDLAKKELAKCRQEMQNAVCSTCKRPYDTEAMVALGVKIKEAEHRYDTAEAALSDASSAITSLYQLHATNATKLATTKTTLWNVDRQLEQPRPADVSPESETEINQLRDTINQAWETLANLKERRQAFQKWQQQTQYVDNEIAKVEERINSALLYLQGVRMPSDESLNTARLGAEAALQTVDAAREKVNALAVQVESVSQELAGVDLELKASENKAKRVNLINHAIGERTDLQKYLRNNRSRLMEDSWTALTQYASHLISMSTEGLITDLTRSESGEFSVIESGHVTPVEDLSGAQKSIVGLSLRLSLAHLFYGDQGFVLLDEVTADATETTAANVAGMLRTLRSQVIMVTHRQSDALNAHHSIHL